jgi:hypothetical protein
VGQPPGFPFNLNSAVDHLLKKEFDHHRAQGIAHPLMAHYGLAAIPFDHPKLDQWRENFVGVSTVHKPTNFEFFGAVDDLWQNDAGELIIVDYKATAKDGEVNLDAAWQDGYKHQMEIYQWLMRANGFPVSNTGYFVYCNGRRDKPAFEGKLEFDIKLIPYTGNDGWVEGKLVAAKQCLDGDLPDYTPTCDYCEYRQASREVEGGIPATIAPASATPAPTKAKKASVPPQPTALF